MCVMHHKSDFFDRAFPQYGVKIDILNSDTPAIFKVFNIVIGSMCFLARVSFIKFPFKLHIA